MTDRPSSTRKFREFETVVLEHDIPECGLRKGDLGAVVELYEPDGPEIEFIRASGKTQPLVTLKTSDVRSVRDEDLISVRRAAQRDGAFCEREGRSVDRIELSIEQIARLNNLTPAAGERHAFPDTSPC